MRERRGSESSSEVVETPGWVGTCPSKLLCHCLLANAANISEAQQAAFFSFPFLIPVQTILETLYTVVLSSAWGWQTLPKRARLKNSRRLQLWKRLGCPFPADNCKRVQWFAFEFRHIWTLCFNIPLVQPLCPLGAGWLTVSQAPNYAKNALYPLCFSYMAICTSSKVGS